MSRSHIVQLDLLCTSMSLLFYYLTLQQKNTLLTSLCMQLHFSGERGKYNCDESAPTCDQKREGLRFTFLLWKKTESYNVCFSGLHLFCLKSFCQVSLVFVLLRNLCRFRWYLIDDKNLSEFVNWITIVLTFIVKISEEV